MSSPAQRTHTGLGGWAPAFGQSNTESLTSVGVVDIPIVYQHLIKEDDASIVRKRLLGKAG